VLRYANLKQNAKQQRLDSRQGSVHRRDDEQAVVYLWGLCGLMMFALPAERYNPPGMTLSPGTKLDGYELLGLLGAGGMGEVYRARDSSLKREVAIKVLPAFVSQDPDRLRRFEQEAQATAALNHPNILAVHRFGVFAGAPYLVSELLEGSTLREVLQRGALPVRKAIDYAVQTAHGLAAAHDKGIVHRDLKPENLFVTRDGRVKILDFGLAKLRGRQGDPDDHDATQTMGTDPGLVMGTAGYMSPEQVRGKPVDHHTDIFSFGAVLYEMLSGKRAFQRPTSAETMSAILNEEPPSISQVVQTAPVGLQRVVNRCLEKNPEQRFRSASDLAFALEALSDSGSAPAAAIPQASRSRWIWAAVAGVAVALIAVLILWWRTPPSVPVVESVTQLTDDGQSKGFMVTDGSRIYFNEPESRKIGQVSVTGGATAPVDTGFAEAFLAGISHDGSALLVHKAEALWLIPLPAGEPRRLGNIETPRYAADIFPDGRIVFGQPLQGKDPKGADDRIDWFIADKNGLNPHKLASLPGVQGYPSVSPSGQRVLLNQWSPKDNRLFEIAADGTGLREIRKFGPDDYYFFWSSDEKYVVYQSTSARQSDIWLLPLRTGFLRRPGDPIRLTNGPLPYFVPRPSRDGKQIFVLGTKQRGELVRYDMKSKQFVPFLGGISATDPTFSQDGKWVVYLSYPDHTVWRSRSDGSERMQLTFPPTDALFPLISPDGTKVSFHTNKGEVFVVATEGGPPQKIADGYYAIWSPDGNYLLYHAPSPPYSPQIIDVRTGKTAPLPGANTALSYWLTPEIVAGPDERGTRFITFNIKTRQFGDLTPDVPGGIQAWMLSPDRQYLYFATGGSDPKAMRVRIADRQVETIASLKDFHRAGSAEYMQINVAPDGSPIVTRDTGYQEIYALNMRWP
jgi:serine/threonine protein kinase